MSRVLRTYAIIDKTRDAELLFREVTVKPYMSEVRDLNKAKPHLATRGTAILSRFGVSLVYVVGQISAVVHLFISGSNKGYCYANCKFSHFSTVCQPAFVSFTIVSWHSLLFCGKQHW